MLVGIETDHHHQPGRVRVDQDRRHLRPVLAQHLDDVEDVSRPRRGVPLPGSLVHRSRQHVVENDDRAPAAVLLGIDEVTQRELEQVHPVDERQVEGVLTRRRCRSREVLVAGGAEERDVTTELGGDGEGWVDPHRGAAGQRQAAPVPHAYLEVPAGAHQLVDPGEELQVAHAAGRRLGPGGGRWWAVGALTVSPAAPSGTVPRDPSPPRTARRTPSGSTRSRASGSLACSRQRSARGRGPRRSCTRSRR